MGYYTDFSLAVENATEEEKGGIESLLMNTECPVSLHFGSDSTKWYEHEEDMKHISEYFPNILFVLDGDGEESLDIWRKYFMNGKMQNANTKVDVVHESFDLEKLN